MKSKSPPISGSRSSALTLATAAPKLVFGAFVDSPSSAILLSSCANVIFPPLASLRRRSCASSISSA